MLAQKRIKEGLGLTHPVLVLPSDKSADDEEWSPKLHRVDFMKWLGALDDFRHWLIHQAA